MFMLIFLLLDKLANKQGSVGSSENSKSPINVDGIMPEKDIVKAMPHSNELVYSYPSSTTDSGEMKRFLLTFDVDG